MGNRGIVVRFPPRPTDSPLLYTKQTGTETHPASYLMDNAGYFLGEKTPRCKAEQVPISAAEV